MATLVLLAGAVALAVIAVPLSRYGGTGDADVAGGAATVSVVSRPTDLAVNTSVDLGWSVPVVVRSSSSGVVSAVSADPDVELGCGVEVFEVEAKPVVSYCGPRPLTTAVSSVSKGRDTDEFLGWLRTVGFFEGVVTPSVAQKRDAIRFWQASLAMVVDGSVDPGELLWLSRPLIPSRVDVTPGVVVSVGDPVLSVEERLETAEVARIIPDVPAGVGQVFGVDTNPARVVLDAKGKIGDVAALEVMLRDSGLLVDGLPSSATGSVRLDVPIELVTVPASSILTSSTGTCVVVVVDGDVRSTVEVEVRSSSVGSVFVDADLRPGMLVLIDPDRSTPC